MVEKLKFQLVMFYLLTESQKVLLFAILNHLLAIRAHTQDVQELMRLLLGIHKMEVEPESDYHQDQEKLFQEIVELQLESLLEEEEIKSLS